MERIISLNKAASVHNASLDVAIAELMDREEFECTMHINICDIEYCRAAVGI